MPGYKIARMDPKQHKETGLVICIHDSLTFKRHHLEQHAVESVWTELNFKRASLPVLGFVTEIQQNVLAGRITSFLWWMLYV